MGAKTWMIVYADGDARAGPRRHGARDAQRRGPVRLRGLARRHRVDDGEDEDAYPLPFHPLELGEAALGALFGYHLEGPVDETLLDPETIPLMRFKRKRRVLGLF